MMDLEKTVSIMLDNDYKKRFVAEYWQVKNRYEKLHKMLVKYDAGTLPFKPKCSYELLEKQADAMETYLYLLEIRAEIECVDLNYCDTYTPENEKITGVQLLSTVEKRL